MEKVKELCKKIKASKLLKAEIIVILVCWILGTLLHFVYEWTGENVIIASFSAVKESVWEHLKLVFYPMLLAGIVEYFFVKKITKNYIEAKTIGIFAAISFIVVVFFTYTGILGTNIFLIDILTFLISIVLGEWISYKLMKRKNESTTQSKILAVVILIFLLYSFIICTYIPPEVNLFRDSTTGQYGIA